MPRNLQEIMADADKLADRFESGEFHDAKWRDATPLRDIHEAFEDVAHAQRRLHDAVSVARGYGHSWNAIGAMLGTSGEAARQRYGQPA